MNPSAVNEQIYLTTLTVSFHRPYDFPPNRIQFPSNERKAEYAMAYADWALGEFYEKAKKTENEHAQAEKATARQPS